MKLFEVKIVKGSDRYCEIEYSPAEKCWYMKVDGYSIRLTSMVEVDYFKKLYLAIQYDVSINDGRQVKRILWNQV